MSHIINLCHYLYLPLFYYAQVLSKTSDQIHFFHELVDRINKELQGFEVHHIHFHKNLWCFVFGFEKQFLLRDFAETTY